MKSPLYAHQAKAKEDALRNLLSCGFHAIFHEVGLGKSRTIIEVAMELHRQGACDALIVCGPKSLAGTWREQVAEHCDLPGHDFIAFDSQKARTQKWQSAFSDFLFSAFPILFVNTEAFQVQPTVLKDVLALMLRCGKVMLVIDESSDIKGIDAKRSANLQAFGKKCAYRVIATGTEITNSPLDVFMQFEFLKENFWSEAGRTPKARFYLFKNRYAILEERYLSGGRTFKEIVQYRRLDELQARMAPYVSRATKAACLDLPEKIHARLPVSLSGESARIYAEMRENLVAMLESGEIVSVANKVALFTKFRQLTGGTLAGAGVVDEQNAKIVALIDELRDTSEQAIIWSCFTEEIAFICRSLAKASINAVRFDGSTSLPDRDLAVAKFRSGEARVFVGNPQAAGQGLNLQNCHVEYWYSLPTQAKQYEQAEGRIHRSGQKETCLYKQVICEHTVDERLAAILKEKTDLMADFRDGTVADILELV